MILFIVLHYPPSPSLRSALVNSLTESKVFLIIFNSSFHFFNVICFPSTACLAALSILIPKLSEAIQTDWRFEVVREALYCLIELLEELKGLVIKSEDHLGTVSMSMRMVFYKLVS